MKGLGFTGMADLHRECWDLLPWLANERASAKDQARIEAHLRDCLECQQELASQRQLRDAIRTAEAVVIAPQTSLQKLIQRIDADAAQAAPVEAHSAAAASASPSPAAAAKWPRWFSVAAAVQGIVIATLVAALWMQTRESLEAPRFMTLTSRTIVPRGPVLRVVFADRASLGDVNAILRSIDAQIVAGPSEAGVYTLTLNAGSSRSTNVADALDRLRADERVEFSEVAEVAVAQSESQ